MSKKITLNASGTRFRLASSMGEAPATPAIATITPAIGDAERPMLDANWEGNIMMYEGIPSCAAIPGINGPKEKKAAFPLPMRTAAPKIIRQKTMTMVNSEKPAPVDNWIRLSIK